MVTCCLLVFIGSLGIRIIVLFSRTHEELMSNINFIDLNAQRVHIGDKIDTAVMKVINSGNFILGPEVAEVERRLEAYTGAKHAITCASGTDALVMVLLAKGIGPGDAVFVPTFTFVATAEVVALTGATPVFVDVKEGNFNIDPASVNDAIKMVKAEGKLTPKAIIPVDLFGQAADHDALGAVAEKHGVWVLVDAAQSFGCHVNGKHTTAMFEAATTSFFPAKPLGCYGDGGAIFTNSDDLAERLLSVRVHGQGTDKYDNIRLGINGRFDTVQAAILLEKLNIFDEELVKRQAISERYGAAFKGLVMVPELDSGKNSSWAQYTLRVNNRDDLVAALKEEAIPSAIYYPIPLHQQTAYKHYPCAPKGAPVSEMLAKDVISLPMHPYLDEATQDFIIEKVLACVAKVGAQKA